MLYFKCPYDNCNKNYASDVSLNLHIKLKHNGGNKTEREKLAVINEILIYRNKLYKLDNKVLNYQLWELISLLDT